MASSIENDVASFGNEDWPVTTLVVLFNDTPDKAAVFSAILFKTALFSY